MSNQSIISCKNNDHEKLLPKIKSKISSQNYSIQKEFEFVENISDKISLIRSSQDIMGADPYQEEKKTAKKQKKKK